jgi:hypothetical protein
MLWFTFKKLWTIRGTKNQIYIMREIKVLAIGDRVGKAGRKFLP